MADFLASLDKHDLQVLACAIGIAFVFVVLALCGPRKPRGPRR
jgi:hypothetical protein